DRTPADVQACLDLPSGYGRVTRLLAATIPAPRITAADVDREAVRFCRRESERRGSLAPFRPPLADPSGVSPQRWVCALGRPCSALG
ncbi:MAG: class I SAM-dependent methyltransferase, partial [Gemmataceae bacterium]|nr:class I SAM-dependent methyltransferase [Gemmataceae bacterium]